MGFSGGKDSSPIGTIRIDCAVAMAYYVLHDTESRTAFCITNRWKNYVPTNIQWEQVSLVPFANIMGMSHFMYLCWLQKKNIYI